MAQQNDGGMVAPAWLRSSVERMQEETRLDEAAIRMETAARPLAEGRRGDVLRGRWLGHALHPLMTDLPIGCFLSSTLLDLVGGRSSRGASRRLIGLGLLSSVPTTATGMADYATAGPSDPRVRRLGFLHGIGNAIAGGLYFRSWRSRRAGRHPAGIMWSLLAGSLTMVTAWLGGHMATALAAAEGERGLPPSGGAGAGAGAGDGRADLFGTAGGGAEPGAGTWTGGGGPGDRAAAGTGTGTGIAAGTEQGELIDLTEASTRLGMPVQQVRTMVDDGLLIPVPGTGEPRFRDTDVEAVRLLGG